MLAILMVALLYVMNLSNYVIGSVIKGSPLNFRKAMFGKTFEKKIDIR